MPFNIPEKFYNLFDAAPMAAAILDAKDFKLQMVNQPMLDLWQKPSSIQGSPLLDFLPELADQEYPELLKRVIMTGKIHQEHGARVLLNRNAKQESVFMDYSYTPLSVDGIRTTAILVMATDVSEREMNKLNLQQSKLDLRALVLSAPVPMCIYRGDELRLEVINDSMLDLWQDTHRMNVAPLQHVYHNGIPYKFKEEGISYSYTPLRSGTGAVNAVCVVAVKN